MTAPQPYTLLLRFTAVPATVAVNGHSAGGELPMMYFGVFIGTLARVVCFTLTLSVVKRMFGRGLVVTNAVGDALLICFAALLLWQSARRLL
jgi:hypothetical protein